MTIIYKPRGKAKEYADLAANLYIGCDHGCKYCYAPSATYKTRESFAEPRNREKLTEQLRKEAPAYAGKEVLFCFTCDPYSSFAAETGITRQAIEALHAGGVSVTILTKGGKRSTADFDLLNAGDKYGTTLTFDNAKDSQEWEPGAALPAERIAALKKAHDLGIFTWASFEPVIKPEQTLALIEKTAGFVDLFKVGKWNHDKRAKEIDWHTFAREVKALLDRLGVRYMLKKDLLQYLETSPK
jgi:DNA repair photolyase